MGSPGYAGLVRVPCVLFTGYRYCSTNWYCNQHWYRSDILICIRWKIDHWGSCSQDRMCGGILGKTASRDVYQHTNNRPQEALTPGPWPVKQHGLFKLMTQVQNSLDATLAEKVEVMNWASCEATDCQDLDCASTVYIFRIRVWGIKGAGWYTVSTTCLQKRHKQHIWICWSTHYLWVIPSLRWFSIILDSCNTPAVTYGHKYWSYNFEKLQCLLESMCWGCQPFSLSVMLDFPTLTKCVLFNTYTMLGFAVDDYEPAGKHIP